MLVCLWSDAAIVKKQSCGGRELKSCQNVGEPRTLFLERSFRKVLTKSTSVKVGNTESHGNVYSQIFESGSSILRPPSPKKKCHFLKLCMYIAVNEPFVSRAGRLQLFNILIRSFYI